MTQVYCAIDTNDMDRALDLTGAIAPITGGIKLGMEFFNTFGPDGVERLMETCPDASYFIDLKFHDIPNTVAATVRTVSERLNPAYLNVHASGGAKMMQAAKEACAKETKLLAVTVLTSLSPIELGDIGIDSGAELQVNLLAKLSKKSGLDGVVCSAEEIKTLRESCGDDFVLMVPGIRPAGVDANDQTRITTPTEAIERGATHLVIGRPITRAEDPVRAATSIMSELAA